LSWSCRLCEHCEHVWIASVPVGSVKLFPNLEAAGIGVFNRVVTTLYLQVNKIGPEGAIAIAEALKVNAVLKNLRKASARFHSAQREVREACPACIDVLEKNARARRCLCLPDTRSSHKNDGAKSALRVTFRAVAKPRLAI